MLCLGALIGYCPLCTDQIAMLKIWVLKFLMFCDILLMDLEIIAWTIYLFIVIVIFFVFVFFFALICDDKPW